MWRKNSREDILSKYVPEDFHQRSAEVKAESIRPYCYMALYLTVEQSDDVAQITAECVKILLMRAGVVHTIISTFIFISFDNSDGEVSMLQASADLLGKFKEKIKIVCGKTETCYTNLGCEPSLRYSLVMPNLDKVLKLLAVTEGGKSVQYDI